MGRGYRAAGGGVKAHASPLLQTTGIRHLASEFGLTGLILLPYYGL
jgi:hypothetical protein